MGNYRNFKLVTYFVAHGTANTTREELERDLGFFEKYMRLDKVYLEPFRAEMASHEQVEMCREVFKKHGLEVAGGLTTVIRTPEGDEPKPRMFDTFCYNDPKMTDQLKAMCRFLGQHFDEYIIDDFFFTTCSCPACRTGKEKFNAENGITDGSWTAYRLNLMRRVSEECILGPTHEVNPNCRVTIKYPNWAESYQATGYAPGLQRDIFDKVYTGTETRDPVTTDQHLPRYLSFSLMTYFENMCPGRNGGGWWDPFSTHITEHYLEQAYLTAFSKPRELMLFCFQALRDHMWTAALGYELDKLDETLDYLGQPVGIPCYLPDNCEGDDNAQDFLGMCGLPVTCTPYFPADAPQLLLTRSSACDPDIVRKLEKYVAEGGRALVTDGFLSAVQGKGIDALTTVRPTGRVLNCERFRIEDNTPEGWPRCTWADTKPVLLPASEHRNNFSWGVVKAVRGEENQDFLSRDRYGKGELWSITLPCALPDLYRLPAAVLSRVREAFPVRGAWLEGESEISLFVYDNNSFVLYPYVMDGAQRKSVRLHVKGARALRMPLRRNPKGEERVLKPLCQTQEDSVFELQLQPGQWELLIRE